MDDDLFYHNIRLTSHLGGQFMVYSARGHLLEDLVVTDPIEDGLKLVISNVTMSLQSGDRELLTTREPTAFALLSQGPHPRRQVFSAGPKLWDVALTIDRSLVQAELGHAPEDLLGDGRDLCVQARPADAAMQAIVMQLLTAPAGEMGNMVRLGTGLNLAALVLGQLTDQKTSVPGGMDHGDLQRISYACEMMMENLSEALDLQSLARISGTNPGKFMRDFKAVTGMTPSAWLQEERLRHAWNLLSARSRSVSGVAHDVGFSPAYFTTLFQRRFKVRPSELGR